MQQKDEKTILLSKTIGEIVKTLRIERTKTSINKIAHEFELDVGNTSRVEKGQIETKVVTLWKIAEAFGLPLSELIKRVEAKLPKNFHFFED